MHLVSPGIRKQYGQNLVIGWELAEVIGSWIGRIEGFLEFRLLLGSRINVFEETYQ